MRTRQTILCALSLALLALAPATASAQFNILLTNDDGFDSEGIQAMRAALMAAGHTVTLVAPATQQSGRGGASTINAPVTYNEVEPGVWAVNGTPADSVRVALDIIMASNPPELVVSGANEGQNVGQDVVLASGTVNAATVAMQRGVPSIAVSLGLNLVLCGQLGIDGCTALLHQFDPAAAALTVDLIAQVAAKAGPGPLMPPRTMLSMNIPTPYVPCQGGEPPFPALCVRGAVATRLAPNGDFTFGFEEAAPGLAIPDFTTNIPPDFCVSTLTAPPTDDATAQWCGFVSVTRIDGDLTADERLQSVTKDFGIDQLTLFPPAP